MSNIQWVPVPGYERFYEISSAGQVRTISRDLYNPDGRLVTSIESNEVRIRKTTQNPEPYVVLHDGRRYCTENLEDLMNKAFR